MFEVNEDMVVYAFRYALGRMTSSVSTVTDFLIENWSRLKPYTRDQIVEEIKESINKKRAGMDCDVVRWKAVLLLQEATSSHTEAKEE